MEKAMERINNFKGEYRFLSNFYFAPIPYREFMPDSVEVAYQASKCADYDDMVMILMMNGKDAKQCGRIVKIRPDWDEVKLSIMEELCRRKFTNYISLRLKLINTGDAILEEGNTWGDTYWGTVNGIGENYLGKILMKIRKDLR
jgi:ribA/ribD-fused uncharacterized protein